MSNIRRITKAQALPIIADIERNGESSSGQAVIKLARTYYDITDANQEEVLELIREYQRRHLNRPEFGVTRI